MNILITALILGLMGSFHCLGMCGPIAFILPVDRNSKAKMATQTVLYHLGRMTAYGAIGLIFGYVVCRQRYFVGRFSTKNIIDNGYFDGGISLCPRQ